MWSIISKIFGLEIAEAKAVFETPIELIAVKILAFTSFMRLHPLPFSHLQEPLQSDLDFLEQLIINNVQYTKDYLILFLVAMDSLICFIRPNLYMSYQSKLNEDILFITNFWSGIHCFLRM